MKLIKSIYFSKGDSIYETRDKKSKEKFLWK